VGLLRRGWRSLGLDEDDLAILAVAPLAAGKHDGTSEILNK
jgi:hypothetical protein